MSLSNRLCVPYHWTYEYFDEVTEVDLYPHEQEFRDVLGKLKGCSLFNLTRITRVQNPYLYQRYMLRKLEYEAQGAGCAENYLLHATDHFNVQSIVRDNLDWRMAYRVKFGQGVSFSPNAIYANHQCSRFNGFYRAMIVARVLIGNISNGSRTTVLPPKGSDTTTGNCGNVYVKYYDDEFYPAYVAYYHL